MKVYFLFFLFFGCARQIKSPHLEKVEDYFFNGKFGEAVDILRLRTRESQMKDRLLYLMEAGSVLHTIGKWKKSNLALREAETIADTISKSVVRQGLSFLLNDRVKNFRGESFERTLIKLYISLNYLMLGEEERAQIYFRRMNISLEEIRELESAYRQNNAARFLYALSAQSMGAFNRARVQYNSLRQNLRYRDLAETGLYYLSILSEDIGDIGRYREAGKKIEAYSKGLNPINFALGSPWKLTNLGSLVFIHGSGMAPYKKSRGKIGDDPIFQSALRSAIIFSQISQARVSSPATFLLSLSLAENPVPLYVERKEKNAIILPKVELVSTNQGRRFFFTPRVMDSYTEMAFRNYNERYEEFVNRNIVSIVTKSLAAVVAVEVAAQQQERGFAQSLTRFLGGFISGAVVAATIAPDLRAWNLTYDNLQVKWILLEPGTYDLNYEMAGANYVSSKRVRVLIRANRNAYVLVRSF